MLKQLLTITALSLVTGSVLAGHHGHGEHRDGAFLSALKQLDLTQQQRQDLRMLKRQSRADRAVLGTDLRMLGTQIRGLVQSDNWDESAVSALLTQRQELMQNQAYDRAQTRHQIWNLLTEAQQAEWLSIREQRPDREDKPARMERMLETLELSDAQQTEVDAILAAAETTRETFKTRMQSFREAEAALIQSANFNEQSWHALQDEYAAPLLQAALARTKVRHEIWSVLDESQRNVLESRANERKMRKQHERHHQKT